MKNLHIIVVLGMLAMTSCSVIVHTNNLLTFEMMQHQLNTKGIYTGTHGNFKYSLDIHSSSFGMYIRKGNGTLTIEQVEEKTTSDYTIITNYMGRRPVKQFDIYENGQMVAELEFNSLGEDRVTIRNRYADTTTAIYHMLIKNIEKNKDEPNKYRQSELEKYGGDNLYREFPEELLLDKE